MKKILPGHGSGGRLMNDMINDTIRSRFTDVQLDDSAILDINNREIVFTTDTFTVTPLFFPGGDIGRLAVNGTVNDLAVMGARPLYLSCALVLEEGLDFGELERVLDSMKAEAEYGGVKIVTGDTKVVPHGKADRIFINTTGIGVLENRIRRRKPKKGDAVIINGTIGDHGMAVMAERNKLTFSSGLKSDCAHLNRLIKDVTDNYGEAVKFMRDPTRGGVASVLNEIVQDTPISVKLIEEKVPVREEVRGICDILGLDPLYVANEGKVLMISEKGAAGDIVKLMTDHPEGKEAIVIGEVDDLYPGKAYVETPIGGRRLLPLLFEEQLPRIC